MKPETQIVALALIVFAAVLLFFIFREVVLWYFKINKLIQIKQAELALLAKQYENSGGELTELEKTEIQKALQK